MKRPIAKKVMGLGRGLEVVECGDTTVRYNKYLPSEETSRRADEMGRYYGSYKDHVEMLLCSGGYPEIASRGKESRPPEGVSEGALKAARLKTKWRIPPELIRIEGRSGSTFDNFIQSIEQKFLVSGEFNPDNPLGASVSRVHSWRTGLIARQSLDIPDDGKSLFRLYDGRLEDGLAENGKERLAYALTKLALAEVDAQPGNLEHTKQASQWFNEHVADSRTALQSVGCSARAIASLIGMPQMPFPEY